MDGYGYNYVSMAVYIQAVCISTVCGQELMCIGEELIGFTGGSNLSTNQCQQGSQQGNLESLHAWCQLYHQHTVRVENFEVFLISRFSWVAAEHEN